MGKFKKCIIGIGLFAVLFYNCRWELGFNVSIFSIAVLVLVFSYRELKKDLNFWILSAGVFFSALSFAYFGDFFSFVALFLTTAVLGIYFQFPKLNLMLYPAVLLISGFSSPFRVLYFTNWIPKRLENKDLGIKLLLYVLVPFIILTLFVLVYSSGSEIFGSFFNDFFIQFDFKKIISVFLIGFFLMFNFWYYYSPGMVTELKINDNFDQDQISKFQKQLENPYLRYSRTSGIISLTLVNLALIGFLFSYNYEQFFQHQDVRNLSAETHQRVGTVIFSIVLAISIILIFFKSVLNFDPFNDKLRKLSYLWIGLNLLLILSTFLKTTNYIVEFGLTYKRIGVIVFLCLCIAGLFFTLIKIKNQKTNYYLLKRMLRLSFGVMVISSWINFSWLVTKYNTEFLDNPDLNYLIGLEYNKIIMNKKLSENPRWKSYWEFIEKNNHTKEKPFLTRTIYYDYLLTDSFR